MWEVADSFRVKLGGNFFTNCRSLISFKDEPVFELFRRDSDNRLGIEFHVYTSDGRRLATIRNGNVVGGDTERVEIMHGANRHAIRDKATGEELVSIEKDPSGAELAVAVKTYLPDRRLLDATHDKLTLGNVVSMGCEFNGLEVGIGIRCKPGAGIQLQ